MSWELDMILFAVLVLTAILALEVRDLLGAVAILSAYSFLAALLFAQLGAVDVAFVEAVLGSAFTGLLLIATVIRTSRTSTSDSVSWPAVVVCAVFLAMMVYASGELPDRGDPQAPAHVHVSPHYIENTLEETDTPNVVTSLLADYRSLDTLGEALVIFTAGIAAALILRRQEER